ncbi:flagellar filament capping protein FliD [Occallatibacter savannae]|uniref:flagellar filament capping protein FliD n=1 Tax=Occallatibacter savannae TaxID=1002691 RepID=UPI000D691EEC|nr:flagellar filament capping protein FliD [Occallatibacter savannae]
MGAVGLNFGSPTSGQGFDVTSTVNQIVTNLQSVEKPWKDQLTALQSKDAALSSLGTQLSTLTSDLQALTDFNGTMAYKTGSSSNTDVLHLSSASASAVAGTHTVVVENLAQVSTAATDAVKATDTIAGSITFRIGTGEWKTVNVGDASSDATVAGLSAAINSANLGVTASVLTNADGTARLSLVSKTDGSAGQITIADATNNPTSPTNLSDKTNADDHANLGLAVIQNGIDATMKVDGVTVTSASNTVSNAIPGVTFQLLSTGTSDPAVTPPSIQVVIDNDTSSIETAIAKLVTDYNAAIKAINTQEGKDSAGKPEPLYGTGVAAQIQEGLLTAVSRSFGSNAINSLIALGIKATPAADGTITLDGDKLTTALNSSFDQVVSLFQDSGSFGSEFMKTLDGLGTNSAAGGAIALALKEDSSQETTLNGNVDRQDAMIATQKDRLTTELNLANQILQAIPQQINQVNEIYSAITGYNRNQNG